MNVRNLKASDAYIRAQNKFIIEKGGANIQITTVELLQLKRQLNEFILHSVRFSEERAEVCYTCRYNKPNNAICDFCNAKFSKYSQKQT